LQKKKNEVILKNNNQLTILCLASYEKGADFIKQCKELGHKVLLLTSKSLEHSNFWPKEYLDNIFFIPDVNNEWKLQDLIYGVSYLARTEQIDRIVALDDFDVEKAASLREHLRCPGMGDTTARYFRDKLAMRARALDAGLPVPEFVHVLNYEKIKKFFSKVQLPYVMKPRLQAGAIGIKKITSEENFWEIVNETGDQQSFYLLERFIPGNIYHVDSIIFKKDVLFSIANQYGLPPMEVAHQGRVFTSRTMIRSSEDAKTLLDLNKEVLKAFGLVQGISHTEFIKSNEDGKFYFLETSARVGGAHVADLVEAASGINLWKEWAKIETLKPSEDYVLPKIKQEYGGLLISLAKQEHPDLSNYNDPEILLRINKPFHAGLIVSSSDYDRVENLIKSYTERFYNDFFISQPLPDKPTS
jgi:biotin carboxylase